MRATEPATGGVRVAAVADLHVRVPIRQRFRPAFMELDGRADVLLLGGDLTNGGTQAEAELLVAEVSELPVPVVAVLGNHDHDERIGDRIADMLRHAGIRVLDGDTAILDIRGVRLGIAGVMGGGCGFPGGPATTPRVERDPDWEARRRRGPEDARRLQAALSGLDCDVRVALIHFAPVTDTLEGEPADIYPSLGCHLLAEAIDAAGADLVIHGHAHHGSERGRTPGGIEVRNVSHLVIAQPYRIYRVAAETVRT